MKNDNENLTLEHYLQHTGDQKLMKKLQWENPKLYEFIQRLLYIKTFQSNEPLNECPECGADIIQETNGEEHCTKCGLVTRSNYPYVAGLKVIFPYGLKI